MRRFLSALVLGGVGIFLLEGMSAVAQGPMRASSFEVWVSDQEGDRLLVLDGTTLDVLTEIPTDEDGEPATSKPHMVLFSPDGRYAYVALVAAGSVAVVDARTKRVVTTIPTGKRAHAPMPSPDGTRLLVVNVGDSTVTEILADTRRGVFRKGRTIPVGPRPICLLFTADGAKAYVTLGGDPEAEDPAATGGIEVIDVARGEVRKRFENTGKNGCGLARYTPDERVMFANVGQPLNRLYAFDTEREELLFQTEAGVDDAHGLWVSPQGAVWVFGRRDGRVRVFDFDVQQGFRPQGEFTMRPGLDLLDASPDGSRLFVAVRGPAGGGETPGVAVIDVTQRREARFVPLGDDPHGLAVRVADAPARPMGRMPMPFPWMPLLLLGALVVLIVVLRR